MSTGAVDVIKAVEYRYIQDLFDAPLFNLGFGDYDLGKDEIDDRSNTNNGDHYQVLNTVLNTIPKFFKNNPSSILMVQGSDQGLDFTENCKKSCRKDCGDGCKNLNRRIKTYRYFVEKNYIKLTKEYTFWGGTRKLDGIVLHENYETSKDYDLVFCKIKVT